METVESQSIWDKMKAWGALLAQFLLLAVTVSAVQYLLWSFIQNYYPIGQTSPEISFADSFVPIATLFSGFAFAGVIWAILLQRKEIQLQRQDLELTRKELTKSAAAQEQTFNLMERDLSEKWHERYRAATPAIVPRAFAHFKLINEDDAEVTGLQCSLTNIGEILFRPKISIDERQPFYLKTNFVESEILPKDQNLIVQVFGDDDDFFHHVPEISILVSCYDITGNKRTMVFAGKVQIGKSLSLISVDFPTREDEREANGQRALAKLYNEK